ncbi:lytic polysaccharide monooxygenase [Streptomyces sp. H27-D2]|uniref:lytic polysaccharide monooxygenase n=1 Tax=Streptomyces sp. H27-D2 TaxID=3046304 RepID=UPI002DBD5AB5|nr:lytic polysaccharide monooxygenase [Streptomyces sp. H27-D2]MEC4020815.1 lytic polysaccharide monooxygenase [Streptomyces sp. H27-D2]
MTARRKAAGIAVIGIAPLALTVLAAGPAAAHGSMTDPVSRVSACFAEGPENPKSAACKALVAASGTQALYDWNAVNIANAAGKSQQIIPNGKLCSAGNDKYKGLDLPRADWPSSKMAGGKHTFRYKGTAPHRGSFELYITKDGYNPAKPLKWSDLESKPFANVADPKMENGDYVFSGKVPKKTGRHLIYSIWQRSDSPEAFYTCSDIVFGKGKSKGAGGSGTAVAAAPAPAASAPSNEQIVDGTAKSTVEHNGHGDADHNTQAEGVKAAPAGQPENPGKAEKGTAAGNAPAPNGSAVPIEGENLAETGGDSSTTPIAIGGAAVLALGASVLFASTRRKAAGRH